MATQDQIAEHLDLSRQTLSEFLKRSGIDGHDADIDQVRVAYIRSLRQTAAGRGAAGDEAELRKARIREANSKAQLSELDFHERIGALIPVAELEPLLESWATHGRNEVVQAMQRVVLAIESRHNIKADPDVTEREISNACRAIGGYARHIGGDAAADIDEVAAAEIESDLGMAAH